VLKCRLGRPWRNFFILSISTFGGIVRVVGLDRGACDFPDALNPEAWRRAVNLELSCSQRYALELWALARKIIHRYTAQCKVVLLDDILFRLRFMVVKLNVSRQ